MKGLDYSWEHPGGAAIKAAGYEFVMRYVAYPGTGGKGLEAAEIADLQANGLGIGVVYESTAGRMREGFDAGREDAQASLDWIAKVGFPTTLPISAACDFDAQPSDYDAIDDYLRGFASLLGKARVGIYGSYRVVQHCIAVGVATYAWQTYAWSGGAVFPGNHCYQYSNGETVNGCGVDFNEAAEPTHWLWWPEGTEEEMTAQEKTDLANLTAIMGGSAKLAEQAARGNDFVLGYGMEQAKLAVVIEDGTDATAARAVQAAQDYAKEYNS